MLLWCVLTASAFAQGGAQPTPPASEGGVPVIYRGQEIVRIHRGVGGMAPAERARLASERLNQLVRDPDFDPTRLTVSDRETYSELVHGDRVVGIVTDEDARAVGRPRAQYARQVRDRLVEVISTTREEFSVWWTAIGLAWAALATAMLAVLLWLLARLGRRLHAHVETGYRRLTADPRVGRAAAVRATRAQARLHTAVAIANTAVAVAFVAVWVQVVLQVLPWSRPYAPLLYRYLSDPVRALWLGFLGVVPSLFYLAVIALTTYLVLRVVHIVFKEIAGRQYPPRLVPGRLGRAHLQAGAGAVAGGGLRRRLPVYSRLAVARVPGDLDLSGPARVALLQLRALEHHRGHDPHLYPGLQGSATSSASARLSAR